MTLVQLEYLVAIDTYRSFVIAAEKCFVTQPTLSMQVQKLEDSLGAKLFDRSKQPVIPTEIGTAVIAQARLILAESFKIPEIIAAHKGEIKGELKVGVIPTVAPYLLPRVLSVMMEKYPDLQLQVWEYTTDQIIHNLKIGLLDCGILSTPLDDSSLKEIPLFYENFVTYISSANHLLSKTALTARDINPDELWLINEGHCMRNQVLNICQQKRSGSQVRNFEYNTGSVETLKRMVDMNSGITVLPELSLEEFSPSQLERVRHFEQPEPAREISIVTHRNFLKRSAITALQKEIVHIVPEGMQTRSKKEVMEIYPA